MRLLISWPFLINVSIYAQNIQFIEINNDLNRPVDIAFEPITNYTYIVEQDGEIELIDSTGFKLHCDFIDLESLVLSPIDIFPGSQNEQGLLGMAFHPQFDLVNFPYYYVAYTRDAGNSTSESVIARFTATSTVGQDYLSSAINSQEIILTYTQPFNNHNGGDLAFGLDGFLYIATGDGGSGNDPQNLAQNLFSYHGKVLRIDIDNDDFPIDNTKNYAIPSDNPFLNTNIGLGEIFMFGLRNPWRVSFDMSTHNFWIGDVGQNNFEEVDVLTYPFFIDSYNVPNFGWRCYEGNILNNNVSQTNCPSFALTEAPIYVYPRNFSNGGFSITGGFVYRGCNFPQLYGYYIFADYVSGNIWLTDASDYSTVLTNVSKDELSSFGQDLNGEVYYVTLNGTFGIVAETSAGSNVYLGGFLQAGHYKSADAIVSDAQIINQTLVEMKAKNLVEAIQAFYADSLSNTCLMIDTLLCE